MSSVLHKGVTHLSQADAIAVDEQLMGPLGFSVDQLMASTRFREVLFYCAAKACCLAWAPRSLLKTSSSPAGRLSHLDSPPSPAGARRPQRRLCRARGVPALVKPPRPRARRRGRAVTLASQVVALWNLTGGRPQGKTDRSAAPL